MANAQPQTTTVRFSYRSEAPSDRRTTKIPTTVGVSASVSQNADENYRRVNNPYEHLVQGGSYIFVPSQTIPSISGLIQSPATSPHMGQSSTDQSMPQSYSGGVLSGTRSRPLYDDNFYGRPSYTTALGATQPHQLAQNLSDPQPCAGGSATNDGLVKQPVDDSSTRVLSQRPKPQCWEHGCNGRQFSTFSNLLRHQRERSGTAAKSYCPMCGAEFTRMTARNGHLAQDKCTKQRQQSDSK